MPKVLTLETAAEKLDVSPRTIYRYLRDGRLRAEYRDKRPYILAEDVEQLKKTWEEPTKTPISRDTIPMLLARLQTLESEMAVVKRLLNISYEELNLSSREYKVLHEMAEVYSVEGWPPHAEEQWADTFLRIKLEDLEKMEAAVEDPHPWKPFLRLAATMHVNPYNASLRDQLGAGRNSIHAVAAIWCTLKGETPKTFDVLVQRDAAPFRKLMRRLGRTRN